MNSRADARTDEILPNGHIVRYSFRERLMHWMNGFAYLYLMLTGLAFWSPWLLWIAVVLGGTQISRMLHPWVGLFFAFTLGWMFIVWASEMHTTETDKKWLDSIQHYIRNEDEEMPPAGRYNMGQKTVVLGLYFLRRAVVAFGFGVVGAGVHSLECAGTALCGGADSSCGGAANHRAVHDSHLYGRLRRAWGDELHDSRRCVRGVCQAVPPAVVGEGGWSG